MRATAEASLTSLADYIRGLAARGERAAIIEQDLYRSRTYSYAETLGKAFRLQRMLAERGLEPGARVVVWGPAGVSWAIAFYGCVLAGAVMVPIDAAWSGEFARRALRQSTAAALCAPAASAREMAPAARLVFTFEELAGLEPAPAPPPAAAPPDATLAEIVYTSGATAEPRGVMITHGNLLANLRPVAHEIDRYRSRAAWLLPLRFLHLIPLSHLFGQVMGLLIPPLIDSAVIFPAAQSPEPWAAAIRRHRASLMICVPQQLQLMSQWALAQLGQEEASAVTAASRSHGIAWRWWRWRRLHRRLGWKMWAFVTGGAALAPEQEELWNALGYAVIQGYGLTETAPAIAITHPFKIRRGAVGRKLAGVEIQLGADGEILVRGANVSPGYYQDRAATEQAFTDGWLHTGDLGRLDAEGNLQYVGRKKETIVTAAGLNVQPEDVERALEAQPEIAEAAAVEEATPAGARVHAVVVAAEGAGPEAVAAAVTRANGQLEPHQRVHAFSSWPRARLPRTASTHKLQRVALAQWVRNGAAAGQAPGGAEPDWRAWLQQRFGIAPERLQPQARLDTDLGLSSLDRVELMAWIETHVAAAGLDESAVAAATTVGELEQRLAGRADRAGAPPAAGPSASPAGGGMERGGAGRAGLPHDDPWPQAAPVRLLRRVLLPVLVYGPLHRAVSRLTVEGAENLAGERGPLLFIANHQSLLDVPVILRALPRRRRVWLATAMGADVALAAHLDARASRGRRHLERWRYRLVRLVFDTFLLTPHIPLSTSLRYAGAAADRGYSLLVFPEGERTRDGRVHHFRPGIGVMVANLRLPVVPVHLEGLFEVLPAGARRVRRGPAHIRFGAPVRFDFTAATPESMVTELEARYERYGIT